MNRISLTITISSICGCSFPSEGTGESSSGFTESSSDENSSGASSASSSTPSTSGPSSTSSSDASSGESESSSSSADPTFGDDATTTGLVLEDYALDFDGSSFARKAEDSRDIAWNTSDFTVEIWAKIHNVDATGVIFDTTDPAFSSGWVLYAHNVWHTVVFSFFDENHQNQVIVGPSISDIGTGWHHIAATKSGDLVLIHVDGTLAVQQQVPMTLAFDDAAPWSLGGNSVDNPDFRLTGMALDDVRISSVPRYELNFDAPAIYDGDDSDVMLLLELDAGDGDVADDESGELSFDLENPTWIAGNTE